MRYLDSSSLAISLQRYLAAYALRRVWLLVNLVSRRAVVPEEPRMWFFWFSRLRSSDVSISTHHWSLYYRLVLAQSREASMEKNEAALIFVCGEKCQRISNKKR